MFLQKIYFVNYIFFIVQIPIPQLIEQYNDKMGGVDLVDNMVACYRYSVQCTVYSVQYSVQCSLQCTVYSLLCSVQCSVQCKVYSVHCSIQCTV